MWENVKRFCFLLFLNLEREIINKNKQSINSIKHEHFLMSISCFEQCLWTCDSFDHLNRFFSFLVGGFNFRRNHFQCGLCLTVLFRIIFATFLLFIYLRYNYLIYSNGELISLPFRVDWIEKLLTTQCKAAR